MGEVLDRPVWLIRHFFRLMTGKVVESIALGVAEPDA